MLWRKLHLLSKNNYSGKPASTFVGLLQFLEALLAHSKHMRRKRTLFCRCTPNFSREGTRITENEDKTVSAKKKEKSPQRDSNSRRTRGNANKENRVVKQGRKKEGAWTAPKTKRLRSTTYCTARHSYLQRFPLHVLTTAPATFTPSSRFHNAKPWKNRKFAVHFLELQLIHLKIGVL